MPLSQDPVDEAAALRERLSRLSEASLRINESLDLDTVLQGVLDSARSLAGARYGVMSVVDGAGRLEALLASGLTPEEFRGLREVDGGEGIYEYLGRLTEPLLVADLAGHARSLGLPEFLPPVPVGAFLAVPIRRLGDGVGHIYVAHSEPGREFGGEDQETLALFAAQAALVIANARRHRDEQRARAGLEALVETSPIGVVVFDAATGAPESFNREALRIVDGLRQGDQSAVDLLDSLTIRRADGKEVALAELPLARLMGAGDTVRAEEMTLLAPGGRRVAVLVNATPIRGGDGGVESYVVTVQDLTELEELGRLRAEFLGLVSQELREPLAAVMGSVTTLLEAGPELDPAETRQFLRIIRDRSDRMRRLIGDLLDVARVETGTLPVTPALVDLAELVGEARRRFLGGPGRRGLEIEVDLPPGLPPVLADGWRMAQALGHLLSHTAARSPGSTAIRVSGEREGLYVAVSVAGRGPEMPAAEPPRGFGGFGGFGGFAPGGAGDRDHHAGLALALCRGIVEAHGGRLRAEGDGAEPGSGFTFTLPAADGGAWTGAPAPGSASPAVHSRGPAGDRLRVLAIDDDPQGLRRLRDALWQVGCTPIITGNPAEVPGLIEEERPHLVLLDAALAGGEGPGVLVKLLETADAPVILAAERGREDLTANALELGASDYLVKPFSPAELAARIRTALRRQDDPHPIGSAEPYVLGGLTIDYAQQRVSVAGCDVELTPTEYAVLAELAAHAGRTLAHDHLLQRVWHPGRRGERWLLREVVKRLRGKLGDDADNPAYVFTVPRVGYRMGEGEEQEPAEN